jgi:RND family efflux transporter MFP subunit
MQKIITGFAVGWIHFKPARIFTVLAILCFCQIGNEVIAADIVAEGLILPSRSVSLSLPVEAVLRELKVQEGALVLKGDILAILYSPVESLEKERAAKQLDLAEFMLGNSEKLRSNAIISEEAARQKKLDCDIARIEARRAEAVLHEKTLYAPFDGFVLRILKEPGETVGRVDKVIDIVDIKTLHADAYLEGEWKEHLNEKTKSTLEIPSMGGKKISATIGMVDPVVDPSSGLFRVRLLVPNPDMSIPSGIPAKITFEL